MSNAEFEATPRRRRLNRAINARTGGALLIWIGIALLGGVGWGVGLLGVGAVLLVEQVVRRRLAIEFERFWVGAGAVAAGLGVAIIVGLQDALVPILLIIAGGALVATTLKGEAAD